MNNNNITELSGLIHGRFRSMSEFAAHIGWSRQRLGKIVNGNKCPTLDDISTISDGLEVPFMMVANIFLRKKSTNSIP